LAGEPTSLPFASVAVPTRNEERTIRACLEALLAQDYARDRFEVIVLDGRSGDRTREIVEEVAAAADVPIRLLDNPRGSVPAALNRAIEAAEGEFLVRVDGHSMPEPAYLRTCVEGNLGLGAELVGGWVRAAGRGRFGTAVAAAFASPFSMGNPGSWNPPTAPREVASVPCGSYRLDALRAIGGFDEEQLANQDYEANYRLRRAGGRVMIIPDVSFDYIPRESAGKLARQFARYGFYKARVMVKHPASVRPRHLVPAAGILGLALLAVAAPFSAAARTLLLLAAAGYALVLVAGAVHAGRRAGSGAPLLPLVLLTMHVAWGAGNLAGLARWLPARRGIAAGATALEAR